jgi:hypothetical protein
MSLLRIPAAALLLLLGLAGCKLIDQTTFGAAPEPEPPEAAEAAAPVRASTGALMTIRYETANPDYQGALARLVEAVRQRRPNSTFEIIGVSRADQAAEAQRDAGRVMADMQKLGVPTSRLRLGARVDPAASVREVRVHLR